MYTPVLYIILIPCQGQWADKRRTTAKLFCPSDFSRLGPPGGYYLPPVVHLSVSSAWQRYSAVSMLPPDLGHHIILFGKIAYLNEDVN
jgi:hypothetical protein